MRLPSCLNLKRAIGLLNLNEYSREMETQLGRAFAVVKEFGSSQREMVIGINKPKRNSISYTNTNLMWLSISKNP